MDTPGFRRASTFWLYRIPQPWRSVGVNAIGRNASAGSRFGSAVRGGNSNDRGITPMTVYPLPSSDIDRPTTEGSRPNARAQGPSVIAQLERSDGRHPRLRGAPPPVSHPALRKP